MNIVKYIHNEHIYINKFFRGIPLIVPVIIIITGICIKDRLLIYLFIGWLFVELITYVLKNIIFLFIQNMITFITNDSDYIDYPIIGRFKRPDGAKNAGVFYESECNISTSQGMPSGHSMIAAFVGTFIYYHIIDKYNIEQNKKPSLLISCILFTLYTMYSRVYIFKVHTAQQTIIGCCIGIIFATYYYQFVKKWDDKMYKQYISKIDQGYFKSKKN